MTSADDAAQRHAEDFNVHTIVLPGEAVSVEVIGAVDLATAPDIGESLRLAQQDSAAVRVDLRGVSFLGSAGLSVLVDAARRADETHARLAIVAGGHTVRRAVEVTGLDAVLHMFDDTASANEFLRA